MHVEQPHAPAQCELVNNSCSAVAHCRLQHSQSSPWSYAYSHAAKDLKAYWRSALHCADDPEDLGGRG